ncbi:alpha/beta hydrolase [Microbacterium protaetiae]|uniref:Alpha/beta hydrolase n=1 Tax=Microbacterium protaetiae TaxID=2509458 RepID=A0A4V0YCY9_9MICO|nr:alpha/beta hydrolase [Microbacterium protaetiae]QAY58871.1 alpha/beta hydrolase [Microbacterium protaetiae]
MALIPVPYDPELVPGLNAFLANVEATPLVGDTIAHNRMHFTQLTPPVGQQIAGREVTAEERSILGPAGPLEITIIRPAEPRPYPVAGALSIHGGGMILGTRAFGTGEIIDYAERYGMVGISVEYRLAPESPGPAQGEDCYAALVWFAEHAEELGVDPERIIATGASAGGGLSAIVALMARDRQGPTLAGQLLNCPMLDDRNETVSSHQYDGIGAWDRNNNHTAWNAICGADRFTDRVSPYTAASRATDLANLPPAFIEVGAAEVFRDEAVDYATRIWAAGGQAELHVSAGGFHGFSGFAPDAEVSRAANAARESWLRRILGVS